MKILYCGDLVGRAGRNVITKNINNLKDKYNADVVIVNGENATHGFGLSPSNAEELLNAGVDCITTGNHVFRKTTVFKYLDDEERILRPLNFVSSCPGHGDAIININGYKMLLLNALGQVYSDNPPNCPFEAIEKALKRNEGDYDFAVLDFHAEATGEKKAIAYNFADKIGVIFGTHTHIQTNDARILEGKCAYVTDIGMCGAYDSILGVKKEAIIFKLKNKMLSKFDFAEGEIEFNGAIFEIDTDTGKGLSCELVNIKGDIK